MEKYVFDTSAWLTLIEDELGADTVQKILEKTESGEEQVFVSFMSLMEVYYITLQERDGAEAETRINLIKSLPVSIVESTSSINKTAAKLKAKYHISVADAWIAALSIEREAILVHKDPEFEQMENEIQTLKLPYKV